MTEHRELFAALAAPFERDEVKTFSKGGKTMTFVTARIVMNRLDDVLGPENWWDDYIPSEHSVLCRLSIRLPGGLVVKKEDAGGYAGMADEGDDDKSGFSDAFKRAAVKFGVGRYLYRDGVPTFVGRALREDRTATNGHAASAPVAQRPPAPEEPAPYPARLSPHSTPAPAQKPPTNFLSLPKAGEPRAFWWFKELGDHYRIPLIKKVEEIAEAENLAKNFKEWDQPTIDRMINRAVAHCRRLPNYDGILDPLVPVAGGSKPGAAAENPAQGAKAALFLQATLLWKTEEPTKPFREDDILGMISAFSAGKITQANWNVYQDIDSIRETAEKIKAQREEMTAGSKG